MGEEAGMSEGMSEQELKQIEDSVHGYLQGVERYGDRAYGREGDVQDMAEDMLLLTDEVRRSHAENAKLYEQLRDESYLADELARRKKKVEAENAELKERLAKCTERRAQLARALGINELLPWEDVKLELLKWEELEVKNAELRERMEELNKALAKLENFLEMTVTYAPSETKRDYAQFVLGTLRADLSPKANAKVKPEEEESNV